MTIDRETRNQMADLLSELVTGAITNFGFEEKTIPSQDPILSAIESSIWCLYDDFKEHKLDSLPAETKEMIGRWVLFLRSNEKYQWPKISYPGVRPLEHSFLSTLLGRHRKEKLFMSSGAYQVWPFFTEESFNKAQAQL